MGPRDWMETVKDIVRKIGDAGDTGGSEAGTVFGKENAILEAVNRFVNEDGQGVRVVKSIQRITATIRGVYQETEETYTINPVDSSRSIVIMERMGDGTDTVPAVPYTFCDTGITVKYNFSPSFTVRIGFWVVEFF